MKSEIIKLSKIYWCSGSKVYRYYMPEASTAHTYIKIKKHTNKHNYRRLRRWQTEDRKKRKMKRMHVKSGSEGAKTNCDEENLSLGRNPSVFPLSSSPFHRLHTEITVSGD